MIKLVRRGPGAGDSPTVSHSFKNKFDIDYISLTSFCQPAKPALAAGLKANPAIFGITEIQKRRNRGFFPDSGAFLKFSFAIESHRELPGEEEEQQRGYKENRDEPGDNISGQQPGSISQGTHGSKSTEEYHN